MAMRMKFRILLSAMVLAAGFAGFAAAADISTHTFTACNLPDTGQTGDYIATFGEDHDYLLSGGQPNYTIYNPVGTSSVTVDNRTGLMWVTNPNDASVGGNNSWENVLTACETGIGAAGTYAGYSDWRLPNIRELASIVDYDRQTPAINTAYFLNTQNNTYWSSTTVTPATTSAWFVNFIDGSVGSNAKTNPYYIRCVRGGP